MLTELRHRVTAERLDRLLDGLYHALLLLAAWLAGGWVAEVLTPVPTPPDVTLPRQQASAVRFPVSLLRTPQTVHPRKAAPSRAVTAASLGIRLVGVLSFSDGDGVAIVQLNDGRRRTVRAGETIRSGLTLEGVWPDRVVLRYQGERVHVPLQRRLQNAGGGIATTPAVRGGAGVPAIGGADLAQVAASIRRQPMQLFRWVSVQPAGNGVRLRPRPGGEALFAQLGFQPGDVLIAVDGLPLQQLMQQPARWQGLMRQQRWQVTLLRNGRRQTIEVSMP